jgi:glycosyltransferase involved in cell wall biosynthesis
MNVRADHAEREIALADPLCSIGSGVGANGCMGRGRLLVVGFRSGPAGVGRDMLNLMNGCALAGVEVHALVETEDNPDFEYLADSVQRHTLPIGEGRAGIARMRLFLQELEPDAVIANKDRPSRLLVNAVIGMEPRPRTLVRVGINQPAKLRHRNPISRWRSRRNLTATYPMADVLVGVSEGVCEGLRELLGDAAPHIRRIYSPMDVDGILAQSREEPTHPWFRNRRGRLLVSVGRLSRMKDQGTMLRAMALLPEDCRLVIFGEGKQRSQLEALVKELGLTGRIDLPGHSANPFAHVARADLFVLSSSFEGFCNALLEALMVGTPGVSTDCPSGPREILDGGRYGSLVPIGQPQALADAILETLDNPPTSAMLEEAVARIEIEQAIPQYLDALGLAAPGAPCKG